MKNDKSNFLLEHEAYELLKGEGIPVPPHRLAKTEEEAKKQALELGFPLVMKVVSPHVIHKSDFRAVKVGLNSVEEVSEAYREIERNVLSVAPQSEIVGMLLMPQFKQGLEVIVGGIRDAQFGPAIMFGLGGIFVELLRDVSFRVAPISGEEAMKMITEIKGYPLLTGFRGEEPFDVQALAEFLSRISEVMSERREIEEMDLNPVFLFKKGLVVADARIKVRSKSTKGGS